MDDRIEKLMAFANDPAATPAERETYLRKAQELQKQHPSKSPTKDWLDDITGTYYVQNHAKYSTMSSYSVTMTITVS